MHNWWLAIGRLSLALLVASCLLPCSYFRQLKSYWKRLMFLAMQPSSIPSIAEFRILENLLVDIRQERLTFCKQRNLTIDTMIQHSLYSSCSAVKVQQNSTLVTISFIIFSLSTFAASGKLPSEISGLRVVVIWNPRKQRVIRHSVIVATCQVDYVWVSVVAEHFRVVCVTLSSFAPTRSVVFLFFTFHRN